MEQPGLTDHMPEVDLLGGVRLGGGGGGSLDLILGIGFVELLSGGVPEQYYHRGQEHGWGGNQ